jgi:hypothetical protein
MRKPKIISNYATSRGPWVKSDSEKFGLFAEHLSEVFSPQNNDQDQEAEEDLAMSIQSQ